MLLGLFIAVILLVPLVVWGAMCANFYVKSKRSISGLRSTDRRTLEPSSAEADRGIVMVAGGDLYGKLALQNVLRLRQLGCTLPVKVFYMGAEERATDSMDELANHATLIDVTTYDDRLKPHVKPDGYRSKVFAVRYSGFKRVFLMDADNCPLKNVEYLFDLIDENTAAVLWQDWCDPWHRVFDSAWSRYEPKHMTYKSRFEQHGLQYEYESGQMVFDVERCAEALDDCIDFNMKPDTYWLFHGDKDTYAIALTARGVPFRTVEHRPIIGQKENGTGGRAKLACLIQRDPRDGSPQFVHFVHHNKHMGLDDVDYWEVPEHDSSCIEYDMYRKTYNPKRRVTSIEQLTSE